jgi:hypothetical protein
MRRERDVMATTAPNPAYGGVRLPPETLETLAQTLRSQSVPMRLFHDARQPVYVENVDAAVRVRPDGEHELWVEFDVEEEGWARYEAERAARGGPGGLSFTLTETFAEHKNETEPSPVSVVVAADAHHFSDDQILAAAEEFTDMGAVKASRLYQFSVVPTALVLIQFLLQEGSQIPPGVFSAWLYDALRQFRRPGEASPAITLEVIEGDRRVTASIPTDTDPSTAEKAIAAWESVAKQHGTYEYTPEGGWRIIRDRRETKPLPPP